MNWNILPYGGLYKGSIRTVIKIFYKNNLSGPNDKQHNHLPDYVVVDFSPPQTPAIHWVMGQTPSNGQVNNELSTIYFTVITISVSHDTFHYTLIILACANTSENNTLPKRGAVLSLGALWRFLGQQPFTNFRVLRLGLMTVICFVTWLLIPGDLKWEQTCPGALYVALSRAKNYGDLQIRYFFPMGFCYLLVWFWYFHNSDLGSQQEEQHKEGRTKSEVSFNHQTRMLGCISSQKDGTFQSQSVWWLWQAERDDSSKTHSGRSEGTDCSNCHHSKQIMGKLKETRQVQPYQETTLASMHDTDIHN